MATDQGWRRHAARRPSGPHGAAAPVRDAQWAAALRLGGADRHRHRLCAGGAAVPPARAAHAAQLRVDAGHGEHGSDARRPHRRHRSLDRADGQPHQQHHLRGDRQGFADLEHGRGAAVAALRVGALGGLINGVLVAYGRLQPIIVTLATGSIWTGIALYIRPSPGGFIPLEFSNLLAGTAFAEPASLPLGLTWSTPIPKAAFVVAGLVIFWLIFRRSRLATRIYAVGSSEGAAYLSGVNVQRAKLAAYTLAGFAAGCAGLINSAQTATGNALGGTIFTLNSIAAVVLGGAALAGGAGSYLGTLAGAYVIAIIPSVLQFYGVSSFYKDLVQGSVLLFAVALGAFGLLRVRNRMDRL